MKKFFLGFITMMALALVTACSAPEQSQEVLELNVVVPSGVPSYSVMKMIHEETQFENANVTYEIVPSADVLASKVMSEDADIAIVPTNLAATIFNKEVGYQLVAAVTWGNLYVISTDETIQTWDDLEGQEIHTFGRGLVPDATFRFLLNQNNFDADEDMTVTYLSSPQEVAQMMIAGMATVAVVPEPVVTRILANQADAQIIIDLQEEWADGAGYPQASLIIRRELIENHPELVNEIVEAIEASSHWANENPELLGQFAEVHDETANKDIIVASIDRLNINFIRAIDSQEAIQTYLEALYSISPDFVGGRVPNEDFFY